MPGSPAVVAQAVQSQVPANTTVIPLSSAVPEPLTANPYVQSGFPAIGVGTYQPGGPSVGMPGSNYPNIVTTSGNQATIVPNPSYQEPTITNGPSLAYVPSPEQKREQG